MEEARLGIVTCCVLLCTFCSDSRGPVDFGAISRGSCARGELAADCGGGGPWLKFFTERRGLPPVLHWLTCLAKRKEQRVS